MPTSILATKLYIPLPRAKVVHRLRLIERLNEGLQHKVTLVSAAAGYGKTTLVSEWIQAVRQGDKETRKQEAGSAPPQPVAWLTLDEGDNDPIRFLTYLVAALQTVAPKVGEGVLRVLQAPQPPPVGTLLTTLLNEITTIADKFVLVLDDYHVIEAGGRVRVQGTARLSSPKSPALWDGTGAVDQILSFLLEYQPPQMHLVIATREDPQLPLARLRARGQLIEVRAADLRFTPAEAATFLNQVMGLNLTTAEVAALESRTEGWIAGLQLAALSMQGHQDTAGFIKSFTGSHRFVLDYLVEEVLQQQPATLQTFLLHTAILERLCSPLCDAVLGKDEGGRWKDEEIRSSVILEQLERANLFIIPLDNERRWYRYHHLFAELLRQRLSQSSTGATDGQSRLNELHLRASQWYEENNLEIEAFHHAVAAKDIDRAARLVEGKGMPLLFRGAVLPVFTWLESLPRPELDARPGLWVIYASALLFVGRNTNVEETLQAAEAALQGVALDEKTRDLIGHIAAIRATMAVATDQVEAIIFQSQRALAYLHRDNLPVRTATLWTLGIAHQLRGDRVAAREAYQQARTISEAIGHIVIHIATVIGLGQIEEVENRLALAAETYRQALALIGDPPMLVACEAHLGLARVYYEWNDLTAAQQHGQQGSQLARQIELISTFGGCELLLGRVQLAQGDVAGATTRLAQVAQFARHHHFVTLLPKIVAAQVLILLRQHNLIAAAQLAQTHELPLSLARVHLAQGNVAAALRQMEPLRRQMEIKGLVDEQIKVMVLQALAYDAQGETGQAIQLLGDALALAEPAGFIRLFVDEGLPMAKLLQRIKDEGGRMKGYVEKLLAAFGKQETLHPLVEPLSQRELEILQLIAQGLSNSEISKKLFLAVSTVKGHNQSIFGKLQVQRRTEAVARARELGLV